jgi:type 1 glutamine amidotransferase
MFVITVSVFLSQRVSLADNPHEVIYEGGKGPGEGKHIVFVSGDHEYRGEETLPALARILAKSYGFKCSVYFTIDKKTGFIQPGSSHIKGLKSLKSADLMVVFLRFQDFEPDQMQHIVDYLDTGRPVVGLRTSTHAFKMGKDRPHAKFSTNGTSDYKGGFGRQILGETWVGHYGRNHRQSSLLILEKDQAKHPILRGVQNVHTQCGGYKAYPIEGSVTLARGRILNGMKADAEPDTTKEEMPVVWTREYANKSGKPGRVFTTTHGASEDILNDGFRRMMLNGCLWSLGMEDAIKPDAPIAFIGPYNPVTYGFGGFRKNVRPADIRGFDTPILGAVTKQKK